MIYTFFPTGSTPKSSMIEVLKTATGRRRVSCATKHIPGGLRTAREEARDEKTNAPWFVIP
ncbi:hypothetical protein PGB90_002352 [Kerria lacca]